MTSAVSEDNSSFLPTLTKYDFPAGEQGYAIFFFFSTLSVTLQRKYYGSPSYNTMKAVINRAFLCS